MKQLPIYIFVLAISLFGTNLFAQNDSILNVDADISITVKDSVKNSSNKAGKLFVGADLFTPVLSAFTDRKGGATVVSYRVYKKWNAVFELGYEQNQFNKLDWKVDVDGLYFKLGFNWFLSQDYEDSSNGFYTGARFAYSKYTQKINQYPIRLSGNEVDAYGSLPSMDVSAYWFEIVGGARVRLIKGFYADVSVRPEIYLGSKKQNGIDPLVIPGYGKDSGLINFSIFWGITYKIF